MFQTKQRKITFFPDIYVFEIYVTFFFFFFFFLRKLPLFLSAEKRATSIISLKQLGKVLLLASFGFNLD